MKNLFALIIVLAMLAGCTPGQDTDEYVSPPQDSLEDGQSENNNGGEIINDDSMVGANSSGLDNKLLAWGFKKEKNKAPDMPSEYTSLLEAYDGYYLGNQKEKVLYLTFDEGYENGYTAQILDVLKKTNTPAAFFVTDPYLEKEDELVQRMVDEGHIVGNHTVNHPSMPSVDDETVIKEIDNLNNLFKEKYGKTMEYFRPPRGEFSERTLSITKDMGYKTIFWSSAYADWDPNNQKGVDYALEQFTSQLHNGSIILLHAVSKDNANALESMINTAKKQGYRFLSLDKL